jgi:triphosphoribosyl-dephospho-CoA synthase
MSLQSSAAEAFISSCRDEILALKPGNVHVFAEGHGMTAQQFLVSAAAAAPPLTQPGQSVGARIRGAVEASFAAAGLNTNLGIVLLCAPLARAVECGMPDIRAALASVLDGLGHADAVDTFQAITRASPGGLGAADRHDVHKPATIKLGEAMAEAAPRDRIAYQYVSNFEDIFVTGFTQLTAARERGLSAPWDTVAVYLAFLAKFPDTHIARKFGPEAGEAVRNEASDVLRRFEACPNPADSFSDLMAFDTQLKAQGRNPGTSADLTVATLFADRLSSILLKLHIND